MVQEAAEGAVAEAPVLAREQDELVPCVVDDLRWHRHHVAAGIVAEMEVFAQAGKYLLALLECQFRPLPGEAAVKRLRVRKGIDEGGTVPSVRTLPEPIADEQHQQKQGKADELHRRLRPQRRGT